MSAPPKEIVEAAMRGDVETLRDWFATGNRDPNAVFDIEGLAESESDSEDNNPWNGSLLHCLTYPTPCLRSDASDAIRLVLAHGADPNLQNREGAPPIHWCEFPEEMSVLIDAGADMSGLQDFGLLFRHHGLALTKLALRRGLLWDFDDWVWKKVSAGEYVGLITSHAETPETIMAFIREFTSAGSWKAYARQPRVELVRLRSLCTRGRATPPPELERLFDCPSSATTKTKAARAARPLPNEVFWHVLSFWRSSRD